MKTRRSTLPFLFAHQPLENEKHFGRSELTGTRIKQKGMFDFVTEDCEDFVNRTKGLTIRE
jgi:hypothetical protein